MNVTLSVKVQIFAAQRDLSQISASCFPEISGLAAELTVF